MKTIQANEVLRRVEAGETLNLTALVNMTGGYNQWMLEVEKK